MVIGHLTLLPDEHHVCDRPVERRQRAHRTLARIEREVRTDSVIEAVRTSADPAQALLRFLETTYEAGATLGFGYWTRREMETERPHADIGRISIAPQAQGGGNGRALVQAMLAEAEAAGIEVLTLDVRGNNHAAMALYEHLGFKEYGRLPDFVAIGEERWDNVFYAIDLRDPGVDDLIRHGGAPRGPGSSERR